MIRKPHDMPLKEWIRFRAQGLMDEEVKCLGCGGEEEIKPECKKCQGKNKTGLVHPIGPKKEELEEFLRKRKTFLS